MKTTVKLPEGLKAAVSGKVVEMTGPLGTLKRDFGHMPLVVFRLEGGEITISTPRDRREDKMFMNTAESHVLNMITGVTKGYRYKLSIVHVHFPMRLIIQGDNITLENFLGSKVKKSAKKLPDVKIRVVDKDVFVEGLDKEHVGQTAAGLEHMTRIRFKDRRVFKDGIYLVERGNINE